MRVIIMGKFYKSSYVFDPFYDTKDMMVIKERKLKWMPPYAKSQTSLQKTLSKIADMAEREQEKLLQR